MPENKEVRKLELCDIAPYLQYKLKCEVVDLGQAKIATLGGLYNDGSCVFFDTVESAKGFTSIKPYLRPLSDYADIHGKPMKDLNTNISIQMQIRDLANDKIGYWECHYGTIDFMAKNHIDFKRLIYHGLAIPIHNTK